MSTIEANSFVRIASYDPYMYAGQMCLTSTLAFYEMDTAGGWPRVNRHQFTLTDPVHLPSDDDASFLRMVRHDHEGRLMERFGEMLINGYYMQGGKRVVVTNLTASFEQK